MSLLAKIKSWFAVPPDTKLVISTNGKLKTNVINRKGVKSADFLGGIEIFNDDTTPAEFVIHVLIKHVGMKHSDATAAMLICHTSASELIEQDAEKNAETIVASITTEAQSQGYPLACKTAPAQ